MRQHKLFYGSSYDRSLEVVLALWPEIRAKFPDAELHVCYGWQTFDSAFADNPERQAWKQKVERRLAQPGIIHHGRVGKEELKKIRESCGIWAYPTFFPEINCITALECQQDGCVPVTMNSFALKETVHAGVKLDGDIYDPDVKKKYLEELLSMMSDEKRWLDEQAKGRAAVQKYSWENIATDWEVIFNAI